MADKLVLHEQVSAIWSNFKTDQTLLQKRTAAPKSDDHLQVPQIHIEQATENNDATVLLRVPTLSSAEEVDFFNPFITFNVRQYLERTTQKTESHKSSNT